MGPVVFKVAPVTGAAFAVITVDQLMCGRVCVCVCVCVFVCVCVSVCVCVCVCVFFELHITAQSGPVILVILCHSH